MIDKRHCVPEAGGDANRGKGPQVSANGEAPAFDYIVVGGGSAGCVVTNRLVDRQGARVLLLEAGWPDDNPMIRMPAVVPIP